MRASRPEWQQKIAMERIEILFGLARKTLTKKPERSWRYVELARRIGTRYNVRLDRKTKEGFCKKCNIPLVTGKTVKRSTEKETGTTVIKCLKCKYSFRKPRE